MINRDHASEMKEFEKMQDTIHDMDWHKAQTEAARNGQDAALALAEAKGKEAATYKLAADFYIQKASDIEDSKYRWMTFALFLLCVCVPVAFVVGTWIS